MKETNIKNNHKNEPAYEKKYNISSCHNCYLRINRSISRRKCIKQADEILISTNRVLILYWRFP